MPSIRRVVALLSLVALATACQAGSPASPDHEPVVVRIELSASALTIGPEVDRTSFTLTNAGEARVSWSIASISAGWISATPASGELVPGASATVTVAISRDGLSRGTHTGTIRVVAGDRTLDVTVSVDHPGTPRAALSPGSIDLGADDASGELVVENTGDAPLDWTISGPDWVAFDPVSGRTDPGGESQVVVTPDRSGLAPGTHTAQLSLASDGGDATATLTVEVPQPAALRLEPGDLDFGESGTSGTLTVINDGGTTLDWSASPASGWITVDPDGGSLGPGGRQAATVRVSRASLTAGAHRSSVRIQSNGGSETIDVALQVPAPPQDGGGSDGGSDDGSGGGSDDGSGEIALEGRVVDQFSRSGVAGLTVQFDGRTVQTDAAGAFRVTGTASNQLRPLGLGSGGTYTRKTFARTGDGQWLVIPRSFDMAAFDDMARDYEPRTIRWVRDPDVYFDVTPPSGYPQGSELDVWIEEVRGVIASFVSGWTNGQIRAASVTVGTSPPSSGTPGTIVIGFSEDPSTYNDPNTVGLARTYWTTDRSIYAARIWLRFGNIAEDRHAWVRKGVVGHELGHALGLGHMDGNTASLMTPSISTSDLSSFDRQAGNVLYTRSPGNTSPDTDNESYYRGGLSPAHHGGVHEWICGPTPRP